MRRDGTALAAVLDRGIARLERATGLGFGSSRRPLLISVQSGAAVSMPSMMETVLDVGVNDETVEGLVRSTGNPRLARDSYQRLIQGFAEVVQSTTRAATGSMTSPGQLADPRWQCGHRPCPTV